MKIGKKLVKLMIYRHESKTTFVEGVEAEDWNDFLIVHMNAKDITEEAFNALQEGLSRLKKQVIVVPREWDMEFYGVEVDTESKNENKPELPRETDTPSG